jgi:hypothetical protein
LILVLIHYSKNLQEIDIGSDTLQLKPTVD